MVRLESSIIAYEKEGVRSHTWVFVETEELQKVIPVLAQSAVGNRLSITGTGKNIGKFPGSFLVAFDEAIGTPDPLRVLEELKLYQPRQDLFRE